jgi:hypothetical protein
MREGKKKDIGNPQSTRFPKAVSDQIEEVAKRQRNSFSGAVVYLVGLGLEEDRIKQEDERLGREIRETKEQKKASGK